LILTTTLNVIGLWARHLTLLGGEGGGEVGDFEKKKSLQALVGRTKLHAAQMK